MFMVYTRKEWGYFLYLRSDTHKLIFLLYIYIFNTCSRVLLTWASMGGGYCAIGSRFVGRGGGVL